MRMLLCSFLLAACGSAPETSAVAPSQLCVVRHAEAYKNLSPPPADRSAEELDALTPRGQEQARAIGERLPEGVGLVWSSPANRTQQTAARLGSPVDVEPDLRSLDGALGWDERLHAWSEGRDPRPDGAESLADGAARVEALIERARAALPPGRHAVIVTHGDIASLALGALRGTPLLERPMRDAIETGEVRCVAFR